MISQRHYHVEHVQPVDMFPNCIIFTVVLAFVSGLLGSYIIKITGTKMSPYDDSEEFAE